MNNSIAIPQDTKKIFMTKGTCSQTFCFLLNRAFGHQKPIEERAADPLASTMRTGHQCGMLWGASLAAGAEAFRRNNDLGKTIGMAITATQQLTKSFITRTNSVNCRDITGYDMSKTFDMVKSMLKFFLLFDRTCVHLAEKWVPEAIHSVMEGLFHEQTGLTQIPVSCASEVVKKMGASDEEMVMVAGFAGGLGLNGNACGALTAAVWMISLAWCKEHPGKTPTYFYNPNTKKILKIFRDTTNSEILCHKICGRYFKRIDEHTEFIRSGGCNKLINKLASS